jgi:hypothetical protein
MKTNLLRTSLLAVVAAAAVYGQSSETLKFNVPFDFIVGSQTLPAGQYSVEQRYTPDAVVIGSADHKQGAIVIGAPLQSPMTQQDRKLVFHRYGNTYFLTEVWGTGNYGRQIPKTRRERELAVRELPHDTTILVASR